jgi:hypothetical protein
MVTVAYRTALLTMKAESEQRQLHLAHEFETAMRKLRIYEELETEIDSAVLRAARHAEDDAVLQSIRTCPSNPERRAKQAVLLAQKLLDVEKQRDELAENLKVTKEAHSSALIEVTFSNIFLIYFLK